MVLSVDLKDRAYNIYLERGGIKNAGKYFNLNRRVLIVTDDGVPEVYAETVEKQCKIAVVVTLPAGESTKCIDKYCELLKVLSENEFTRSDCVVAVGGGVMGDLAGFVAASYMRGIDFYNIPTTLLSQVDSSIGGKVAIDFLGYKNIVGAFHQPKAVIVDADLLKTLDARQISCGLAEALKMSINFDEQLFALFETDDIIGNIDQIIEKSLKIKKSVVEKDETEKGLRKVLNFGHTLGHAIETIESGNLLHGECVAIGMLPMVTKEIRKRLVPILNNLNLKTSYDYDVDNVIRTVFHDKKKDGDEVSVIISKKIGTFEIVKVSMSELKGMLKEYVNS